MGMPVAIAMAAAIVSLCHIVSARIAMDIPKPNATAAPDIAKTSL